MTVILIGWHDDAHLTQIESACHRHAQDVVRLELGRGPSHYQLHFSQLDGVVTSSVNGVTEEMVRAASAIFALPIFVNKPSIVDLELSPDTGSWRPEELAFGIREWNASIFSVLWRWERISTCPWIITWAALDLQDRKPALLGLASETCGLSVPRFIVSNEVGISVGLETTELVAKAVNMFQEVAPGEYFNTSRIDHALLQEIDGASPVPSYLQEMVHSRYEYRVYCVLGELFAIRMSRSDARDDIDIRVIDQSFIEATRVELPQDIAVALVKLTDLIGIKYCSFDLVEDEKIQLIDVNPAGSWYYIEEKFGIGVSDWIVDQVLRKQ